MVLASEEFERIEHQHRGAVSKRLSIPKAVVQYYCLKPKDDKREQEIFSLTVKQQHAVVLVKATFTQSFYHIRYAVTPQCKLQRK